MPHDWRALLDHLRIEWVDRGPNTQRGRVNVRCPFCGDDDPSHHMSIDENVSQYYCFRNAEHGGRNPINLVKAFGLDTRTAVATLDNFADDRAVEPKTRTPVTVVQKRWERFLPANESEAIDDYLRQRGFNNIAQLCQRYNLRYAPRGTDARRVLFPLTDGDAVVAWTGRSIDSRGSRYLMQEVDLDTILYVPRPLRETVIIVEGPIDALKIAAATESMAVSSLALMGLGVSDGKLVLLRKLLRHVHLRLVALDAAVPPPTVARILGELRQFIPRGERSQCRSITVPDGYSDPGEMSYEGIVRWVTRELRDAGQTPTRGGRENSSRTIYGG